MRTLLMGFWSHMWGSSSSRSAAMLLMMLGFVFDIDFDMGVLSFERVLG